MSFISTMVTEFSLCCFSGPGKTSTGVSSRLDITGLGSTVQTLFEQALAPATRHSYSSAQQRFLLFCKKYLFVPLPLSESLLCFYVAFLYSEGLAHASIKSYLSAIRQLQIRDNLPDPFAVSMPRLEQVLRGVKVLRGKQGRNARSQKLPITPPILRLADFGEVAATSEGPNVYHAVGSMLCLFFWFFQAR